MIVINIIVLTKSDQGHIPSRHQRIFVCTRDHRGGHVLPQEQDPRICLQFIPAYHHHFHWAADRQGLLRLQYLEVGFWELCSIAGRAVPPSAIRPYIKHAQSEGGGILAAGEGRALDDREVAASLGHIRWLVIISSNFLKSLN